MIGPPYKTDPTNAESWQFVGVQVRQGALLIRLFQIVALEGHTEPDSNPKAKPGNEMR